MIETLMWCGLSVLTVGLVVWWIMDHLDRKENVVETAVMHALDYEARGEMKGKALCGLIGTNQKPMLFSAASPKFYGPKTVTCEDCLEELAYRKSAEYDQYEDEQERMERDLQRQWDDFARTPRYCREPEPVKKHPFDGLSSDPEGPYDEFGRSGGGLGY